MRERVECDVGGQEAGWAREEWPCKVCVGGLVNSKHNGKTLKDVVRVACSVSHFKRSSGGIVWREVWAEVRKLVWSLGIPTGERYW